MVASLAHHDFWNNQVKCPASGLIAQNPPKQTLMERIRPDGVRIEDDAEHRGTLAPRLTAALNTGAEERVSKSRPAGCPGLGSALDVAIACRSAGTVLARR